MNTFPVLCIQTFTFNYSPYVGSLKKNLNCITKKLNYCPSGARASQLKLFINTFSSRICGYTESRKQEMYFQQVNKM